MSNQSNLNIYTLLIGINYYFPNTLSDGSSYSCLQGAVRDINLVESFLKEIRQVPGENIFKLTASASPNSESPLESPENLPTYKNIITKFQELTEIASAGGLTFGLIFGPSAGLVIGSLGNIKTVETLKWSWQELKKVFSSKQFWFTLLLLPGAALFLLPIFVLIFGLKGPEIQERNYPNQGIFKTARNAIILGSINGLIFLLIFGLMNKLMVGLIFFLIFGLLGGLMGGGTACIRHFILRLFCYLSGYMPWNYACFLNYATEYLFLQKVGGGYIFIHRMLMEHFANMKVD